MANLNLSEFTEKLFVADADHTFIWDTAASISKRVSRNSWLNSGTLTSDAPVTISQTWNNAAVAFTGVKFNAAGTSDANSAAGSLLADFQLNGVTKFSVTKAGRTKVGNIIDIGSSLLSWENPYLRTYSPFSCARLDVGAVGTVLLEFDAANTLALRNGALAQTFNVYGTYTSGTSYERLTLSAPSAANAIIGTNKGSGGGTARGLDLHTDGAARMTITTAGNVGIGTTAPGAKLEVVGGSSDILVLKNAAQSVLSVTSAGGAGNIAFSHSNSPQLVLNQSSGNKISLGVGSNNLQASTSANVPIDLIIQGIGGNVGIGTTSPTSKLQVSAGDVEVDTIAKGVILKSPDGTRYRVTVANGGTLSVAAV